MKEMRQLDDAPEVVVLSSDTSLQTGLEREHSLNVLGKCEGNRERASAILGISSRTLYRKLREYEHERGIDPEG